MENVDSVIAAQPLESDDIGAENLALVRSAPSDESEITTNVVMSDYDRFCDIAQFPEVARLKRQRKLAARVGVSSPYFRENQSVANSTVLIGGRELISYSGYNYLGLSGDERVGQAVTAAVEQYGTSVSASRVAGGQKPIHRELEAEVAATLGVEDAIAFVGGHATNVITIGHLMRKNDLVLFDALSHNSIIEGAAASGARLMRYPHEDWQALERLLERHRHKYERVLIPLEGVYSMDGDICNLPEFIRIKRKYKAMLLVDEAHSMGVLGKTGGGIREHYGIDGSDVDLWMGTFSKAFASCGGYIAGSKTVIEYLKYTCPGFIYSVGMTPANAAAALQAMRLVDAERVATLRDNCELFLQRAKAAGLNTGNSEGSAVVPVVVGNSYYALRLVHSLYDQGIDVQGYFYPVVPEKESRLRFFITSTHTEEQIAFTINTAVKLLAEIKAEVPNPPSFEAKRKR